MDSLLIMTAAFRHKKKINRRRRQNSTSNTNVFASECITSDHEETFQIHA